MADSLHCRKKTRTTMHHLEREKEARGRKGRRNQKQLTQAPLR